MKISVVTPSLNQGQFINDTIASVQDQNYPDFEHIIIDGGSTDNTIEILESYNHLKWISEKDNGQADAINKGFKMASGEIIAWLNSDDYYDANIFKTVVSYFELNPTCKFLYGDITYIDEYNKFLYKLTRDEMTYENLQIAPDVVRQPSCFWHKDVLQRVGFLNDKLNIVMDYEYFLRVGRKFKFHYIPYNLSFFRSYSTNKTRKLMKQQALELYMVMKNQKVEMNFAMYKFLLGRYIDSYSNKNIIRKILEPLRKRSKSA